MHSPHVEHELLGNLLVFQVSVAQGTFLIAVGCEGKPNHRPGVAALPKQHNQRDKHSKNRLRESRALELKKLAVRVLTGLFL